MNIYYDFEFLEQGPDSPLLPISLGMVRDDGAEYYAVCGSWRTGWLGQIGEHAWLTENVVPFLPVTLDKIPTRGGGIWNAVTWDKAHPDYAHVKTRSMIAAEVRNFILAAPDPQLWGWYCAYDHVLLAQLFGRMTDLPDGIPMHSNDLKQEAGETKLPPMPGIQEHNALSDAREIRWRYHWYEQNSFGYCQCGHVVDGLCDVV